MRLPTIYRSPADETAGAPSNTPAPVANQGGVVTESPAGAAPVPAPSGEVAAPVTAPANLIAAARSDLDAWATRHLPDSPISRNTGIYNRIHGALMEIRDALDAVKE